ncbi:MAG: efflux RND transporter periplasmic adaptor subunit [Planctomycetes bacterium]|nr:efflux RND transporter periplasmic adaptor subunit [Planctomycetota bacterium]
MKYWIVAIVLLAGGAAAAWAFLYRDSSAGETRSLLASKCIAVRGPLRITLVEAGTLKAKNAEIVTSKLQRGGLLTWLVTEGQEVKKDEVLARLDDTDIKREIEDLESQLSEARTNLKTAQNDLEIQLEDNAASLAQAQLDLDSKTSDFELFEQVSHPGKSQELQDRLTTSELDQKRIEERHERAVKLKEEGFVTEAELKSEAIELRRATMTLDQARTDLKAYNEFTSGKDRRTKEFAVTEAQHQLERAVAKAESLKAQREATLTQRERQVRQLEERLRKKKEELAQTEIKSPGNGIVIYGSPEDPWQRNNIKIGGQAWPGMTLFTLPDLREMQVSLNIHEADINKVKVGLPTVTTCDTYPGLSITGKIEKIATLANSGQFWMPQKVKEFTVTVTLDQANLGIKPGISAKTEVMIEELADVIHVPVHAVFITEGKHYCFVDGAAEIEERRVEVGASTDIYAVVKSGIVEGERVLLYRPDTYRPAPKAEESVPPAAPAAASETVVAAAAEGAPAAPAAAEAVTTAPGAAESVPTTAQGESAAAAGAPLEQPAADAVPAAQAPAVAPAAATDGAAEAASPPVKEKEGSR